MNLKILEKILENLWNTASYFGGGSKFANTFSMSVDPWSYFQPFAKLLSVSWHNRILKTQDSLFANACICILVSGQVQVSGGELILNTRSC